MTNHPQAIESDILVQQLPDELLIYNLKTDKVFCLNQTSAMVWQMCDGKQSVAEISRAMSKKLNSVVSEDFVWLAIDGLKKDGLIANGAEIPNQFNGMSRREVIRKIGFASMIALPIITNLVAPKATAAASGCPPDPNVCQTYIIAEGNCTLDNRPNGCIDFGANIACQNGVVTTCFIPPPQPIFVPPPR